MTSISRPLPLRRAASVSMGELRPPGEDNGGIPVWGANGVIGWGNSSNLQEEAVVVGQRGSIGTLAVVSPPAWITNNALVVRPKAGGSVKYIFYALTSAQDQLRGVATAVPMLTQDMLRAVLIPVVDRSHQNPIAKYLDAETARIDALIAKKRRMLKLLNDRLWLFFIDRVEGSRAKPTQLRRAFRFITDGPFGSAFASSDYSPEGAAVVRLGNIGFGEYRSGDQAYIPISLYDQFLRHKVSAGDLLIAGLGDATNHPGRACVAPHLGPAIVKGKCFCARVRRDIAVPEYLALLLSSPVGVDAVGLASRGSTRTMINLDIIKSALVPLPSLVQQEEVVRQMTIERTRSRKLTTGITKQIHLLMEHRQALVTAAVTGGLGVPGVAA